MSIIASQKLFYTHAWETYLIGGLVIFLIGFLLGWLIWRHCRVQAARVEALNDNLRERKNELAENNRKLAGLFDELSNKPNG